jgi:preprotein translocase subunit SecF
MEVLRGTYGADQIGEPRVTAEVGTRMNVPFTSGRAPSVSEVAGVLKSLPGVSVSDARDPAELAVRLPGVADLVVAELKTRMEAPFLVLATDAVGPKVGADLRTQGFVAVVVTLALILVYVGFRFDIAFAPGAVLALIHDVSLTAGVFVLIGLEFNLAIVGALLTIVGYSLNDTIVIYDRIRENMQRYRRKELPELINTSINETFSRTIATSLTTLIAISPFLVFGGPIAEALFPDLPSAGDVIWAFSFAMLIGIIFGTYSTIYIASPALIFMQQIRPYLMRLVPDIGAGDAPDGADVDAALAASERKRKEREAKAPNAT